MPFGVAFVAFSLAGAWGLDRTDVEPSAYASRGAVGSALHRIVTQMRVALGRRDALVAKEGANDQK